MSGSAASCRVVVHLDLDCFYAQVEQRRLQIPADEPVAVQQWGSLLAVNYIARKFGVKRSEHINDALKKCPSIHLPHVDTLGENRKPGKPFDRQHQKAILRRYRVASREIFAVLRRLAPCCEKAGIDEAFLDITQLAKERLATTDVLSADFCSDDANSATKVFGISQMGGIGKTAERDPDAAFPVTDDERLLSVGATIANEIRRTIFQELQYTCSTGIATNKLLAKLASPLNKPDGQTMIAPRFVPLLMQHFPLRSVRGLGGKLGHQLEDMIRQQLEPTLLAAPSVRRRPAQAGSDPQTKQEGEETSGKKMNITAQGFVDQFRFEDLAKHLGHDTAAFVVRVCAGDDGDEPVNEKKAEVKMLSSVKQFDQRSGDALVRIEQLEYWVRVLCEEIILRCEDERVENKRFPMQLAFHSTRVGEKPKSRKLRIAQTTTVEELFKATMAQLRLNAESLFPCAAMTMHAKDFVALDSTAVSSISSYLTKQQQPFVNQDAAAAENEDDSGVNAQAHLEREFRQFAASTQTRNGPSSLATKRKKISSFFQTPMSVVEVSNDPSAASATALASQADQDHAFDPHQHRQEATSPPARETPTSAHPQLDEAVDEEDAFAQFRSTTGHNGKQRPTFYCDRCLRMIAESRTEHQDFHFALDLSRSERSSQTAAVEPPPAAAPATKRSRKSGPLDAFLTR